MMTIDDGRGLREQRLISCDRVDLFELRGRDP